MYKEVFTAMIGYLVDRIQTNYALQLIPNSFLSNSTTSATFASILLQFLLKVDQGIWEGGRDFPWGFLFFFSFFFFFLGRGGGGGRSF